jgi:succinate dehydrogenase / fumarate reductase cytochrome b subunit
MSLVRNLFCSSLGKKYIMAITGLLLLGFVTGHLVGNLHVFWPPDEINGYAHFLQGLGPVLWLVRLGLLAILALHVWAMAQLTIENAKARPVAYGQQNTIQATLASRTMRMTGMVVAAFIVYHILHFTVGVDCGIFQGATFKGNLPEVKLAEDFRFAGFLLVLAGTEVKDVHSMIVLGFQNLWVALFYIVATGLLSFHVWHGFESAFQSLGLRTSRWGCCLRRATRVFAVIYFLGSLSIPASIYFGCVQPRAGVKPAACPTSHSCPLSSHATH